MDKIPKIVIKKLLSKCFKIDGVFYDQKWEPESGIIIQKKFGPTQTQLRLSWILEQYNNLEDFNDPIGTIPDDIIDNCPLVKCSALRDYYYEKKLSWVRMSTWRVYSDNKIVRHEITKDYYTQEAYTILIGVLPWLDNYLYQTRNQGVGNVILKDGFWGGSRLVSPIGVSVSPRIPSTPAMTTNYIGQKIQIYVGDNENAEDKIMMVNEIVKFK